VIEFHYRGMAQNLMDGITVENARWLADLLLQLSDKQIEDAFRAANYKPEDVQTYAAAVKARIRALDEATKQAAAETAG
jgi:ribosomal protein L12E/L44/L45/RPP1/RPP2